MKTYLYLKFIFKKKFYRGDPEDMSSRSYLCQLIWSESVLEDMCLNMCMCVYEYAMLYTYMKWSDSQLICCWYTLDVIEAEVIYI
jgi:hypothetical protein